METMKRKKVGFFLLIVAVVIFVCTGILYFTQFNNKQDDKPVTNDTVNKKYLSYKMSGNSLEDYDLYFLQIENEKVNKVYSPLSTKYALEMLAEGANGETKEQLDAVLGSYVSKKYTNNKNMSFVNALYVRDSYKDSMKELYTNNLIQKYNANVFYDSFASPNNVNAYVKKNTFNLIDNLVDDVSSTNFLLINSLAIDMEWVNKIKPKEIPYGVSYPHEDFSTYVSALDWEGYHQFDFEGMDKPVAATDFDVTVNKYDIIKELGEDNIRKTIAEAHKEYLKTDEHSDCHDDTSTEEIVDLFIKDLKSNYKKYDNSTDFNYYVDDNVKVFAKDLKTYAGTTLQYVGIMPVKEELDSFIKNTSAKDLNRIISKIKDINYDSFKEGVITNVHGSVPIFKFAYELKYKEDLEKLGITNVFNQNKSDLSNMTSSSAFIGTAVHKANIDFNNDGIKAAAATGEGGWGGDSCGFDYIFDVPVEKIDVTFNRPYMFMVRDKDSGEVWFMGTVYEPTDAHSIYD